MSTTEPVVPPCERPHVLMEQQPGGAWEQLPGYRLLAGRTPAAPFEVQRRDDEGAVRPVLRILYPLNVADHLPEGRFLRLERRGDGWFLVENAPPWIGEFFETRRPEPREKRIAPGKGDIPDRERILDTARDLGWQPVDPAWYETARQVIGQACDCGNPCLPWSPVAVESVRPLTRVRVPPVQWPQETEGSWRCVMTGVERTGMEGVIRITGPRLEPDDLVELPEGYLLVQCDRRQRTVPRSPQHQRQSPDISPYPESLYTLYVSVVRDGRLERVWWRSSHNYRRTFDIPAARSLARLLVRHQPPEGERPAVRVVESGTDKRRADTAAAKAAADAARAEARKKAPAKPPRPREDPALAQALARARANGAATRARVASVRVQAIRSTEALSSTTLPSKTVIQLVETVAELRDGSLATWWTIEITAPNGTVTRWRNTVFWTREAADRAHGPLLPPPGDR
ncbi:hypothetical protein AB0G74_30505 [Streptomyces sp. NPDC020875]|uniref:hypothetical protein n=1 Tax=Streptomyces sp. NPDC020875 TaxID=3154898 RepID=UPI00340C31AE